MTAADPSSVPVTIAPTANALNPRPVRYVASTMLTTPSARPRMPRVTISLRASVIGPELLHCRRGNGRPGLHRRNRRRAAVDPAARAVRDRDRPDRRHARRAGARHAGGRRRAAGDRARREPPRCRRSRARISPSCWRLIAAAASGAARRGVLAETDDLDRLAGRALPAGAPWRAPASRRRSSTRRRGSQGVPLWRALGGGATAHRAAHRHHAADLRSRTDVGRRRARTARAGFSTLQGEGRPRLARRPARRCAPSPPPCRTRGFASTPTPASRRATRWRCSTPRSPTASRSSASSSRAPPTISPGMAEVAAHSPVPVVADESFRGAADLDRIARRPRRPGREPEAGQAGRSARRARARAPRPRRRPRASWPAPWSRRASACSRWPTSSPRWAASTGSTSTPRSCSPTIRSTGGWRCDGPRAPPDRRARAGRQRARAKGLTVRPRGDDARARLVTFARALRAASSRAFVFAARLSRSRCIRSVTPAFGSAGPITPRRGFAPFPFIFALMIAARFAAY